MANVVDSLFDEPDQFFAEWLEYEAEVIAALEHANLASLASDETKRSTRGPLKRIRNWRQFVDSTVHQSLMFLNSPDVLSKRDSFIQAVTSIEVTISKHRSLIDLLIRFTLDKQTDAGSG